MRALAVGLSVGVLSATLAAPGMILAQEPEPAAPAPTEPAVPAPAPPTSEATPPPETDPPPATDPEATPTPFAEQATATPVVAKGSVTVSMGDFFFDPTTITINVGDTITWVNNGEEDHDAAGSGFSTGTIPPGSSGSATFSSPGTIPYICNFHPDDMTGTVIVSDTGGTDGGTDGGTGVDPDTGAPLGSEAAAGAAPGAAGTGDALPASGEAEAPLLILGAGLLGCGLLATALTRWRLRETALFPPAR